LLAIIGPTSR